MNLSNKNHSDIVQELQRIADNQEKIYKLLNPSLGDIIKGFLIFGVILFVIIFIALFFVLFFL